MSSISGTLATASISAGTSELSKSIAQKWIIPKIEKYIKRRKIDKALMTPIDNLFEEYLSMSIDYFSYVNIISLSIQQINVEKIYIPLTIFSSEKNERIQLKEYDTVFFSKYKNVIIEDTAGMGKSTILKRLFISACRNNYGIPVFIELRNLSNNKNIVDTILDELYGIDQYHNEFIKDIFFDLLNRGDFIFFLDGYDEISLNIKSEITVHIKKFIEKAKNNIFIITSRNDDSLISFGMFQKFEVLDMTKDEAYSLFRKYDSASGCKVSENLIQQIKEMIKKKEFIEFESFLGNPLLVSLLYLTYRFKRDIPSVRIDFYRKVYDALYKEHDLSKDGYKREKRCGLSNEGFKKVLNKLGFICMAENDNNYNKEKLLDLISKATKSAYTTQISIDDIYHDLIEAIPLFAFEGLTYKWAHKSFMEYFGACYVYNNSNKESILNSIRISKFISNYTNMLDFYFDLDRVWFDRVFVYPIITHFIKYIKEKIDNKNIGEEQYVYFAILFNRMICHYSNYPVELRTSDVGAVRKFFERIFSNVEHFNDYKLLKLVSSSIMEIKNLNQVQRDLYAIFINDKLLDVIFEILWKKGEKIIKDINNFPAKTNRSNFCWHEKEDISQLGNSKIINRLGILHQSAPSRRLKYIDFQESIRYKEMIEKEKELSEQNIMLI